ncbi:ABC transporter permease [Yimella sp. cx-51]|uniref:ABC transporter permease n=1 Tax=Yimella sp. cx-51 TaxID=2770551 RepID=UPI00165E2772|nr:ABC transporter permease [Yimella sp. cx-51]MBC9958176.1 ABC transporter permease [Yimella sp. cx-51]QTH38788.1 ABC transporter permease [Yimella sp. cx-51]
MSTATATHRATPSSPVSLPKNKWARAGLAIFAVVLLLSILRTLSGANDMDSSGAISSALSLAVPIGLAALGGLWSERAGIVNIGLEGMMILGTWAAAFGTIKGGVVMGIIAGILGGMLGGALHALATVTFGVDHIVSGVAINIIGFGLAKYLAARIFPTMDGGGPTNSPPLDDPWSFSIPGISALKDIETKHWFFVSDVAGILGGLGTNLSVLTVLAIALVVGSIFVLWRTTFGLRLRSCGENPEAAETLGVNVILYKFVAVLISGGLAGLAGAFLAMVAGNGYVEGQTGGRGYIGLAAMIFGNWMPLGLAAGALLFGYTDAIQLRQGGPTLHALLLAVAVTMLLVGLWQLIRNKKMISGIVGLVIGGGLLYYYFTSDTVPSQFTSMTPYVTTLLVMAVASQRLRMPAADGQIYRKGQAH